LTIEAGPLRLPGVNDPSNLRASDEDRERAAEEIREHYASGRLNDDELSSRLSAAYGAQTRGELQAVRADLPALPPTKAEQKAELVARRSHLTRRLLQQTGASLGVFIMCTVIWAASGASGFFWPIFTLFAILPLIRNGWALYGPAPEFDRVERHLQSLERGGHKDRDSRRDERQQRRSEHRRHRL
jgi:Domain of unknown function (DUF1707)